MLGAFLGTLLACVILLRDILYIAQQWRIYRNESIEEAANAKFNELLKQERSEVKIEREIQRRLKQRRKEVE